MTQTHPAHYAVQKVWRNVCDDIVRTQSEIDQTLVTLEKQRAALKHMRVTRLGLEDHAAQQGWALEQLPAPIGINSILAKGNR